MGCQLVKDFTHVIIKILEPTPLASSWSGIGDTTEIFELIIRIFL